MVWMTSADRTAASAFERVSCRRFGGAMVAPTESVPALVVVDVAHRFHHRIIASNVWGAVTGNVIVATEAITFELGATVADAQPRETRGSSIWSGRPSADVPIFLGSIVFGRVPI